MEKEKERKRKENLSKIIKKRKKIR